MTEYDFLLKFQLSHYDANPEDFMDNLYESGCDDATVGIGQNGRIALNFTREAKSAFDAVSSAIVDVKKAIPDAVLIEATPDLVGLTDIADILGCSRQNIRKIVIGHHSIFPSPIHEGHSTVWHLSKVLHWFKDNGKYRIEDSLIEISKTNMQINLAQQMRDLEPEFYQKIASLF